MIIKLHVMDFPELLHLQGGKILTTGKQQNKTALAYQLSPHFSADKRLIHVPRLQICHLHVCSPIVDGEYVTILPKSNNWVDSCCDDCFPSGSEAFHHEIIDQ